MGIIRNASDTSESTPVSDFSGIELQQQLIFETPCRIVFFEAQYVIGLRELGESKGFIREGLERDRNDMDLWHVVLILNAVDSPIIHPNRGYVKNRGLSSGMPACDSALLLQFGLVALGVDNIGVVEMCLHGLTEICDISLSQAVTLFCFLRR